MDWKRLLLVPLMGVLASCSMDGGSSGTGITTAEGNVSGIQLAASALPMAGVAIAVTPPDTATSVAGITVAVEGSTVTSTTDSDGRFVVRGRFDGYVTLLFQLPGDPRVARLDIIAPADGTVTLRNVQIDLPESQATVESQFGVFDALVERTDCDHTLSVVSPSKPDGAVVYTLDLSTSSLHDHDGNAVACRSLMIGDRVHVEGFVDSHGSFGSADVEVEDP